MFYYFETIHLPHKTLDNYPGKYFQFYCLKLAPLENLTIHLTFKQKQQFIYYESQLNSLLYFYHLECLLFISHPQMYCLLIFVLLPLYFIFLLLTMNENINSMEYDLLFLALIALLFALVCRSHPLPCA